MAKNIDENKLIDLVEENQILWDSQLSEYKNIRLKNDKWNEIAKQMDFEDVGLLKNKWHNIRTNYFVSRKKGKSGSGAGRKPNYSRDLSFLNKLMIEAEGSGNRSSSISVSIVGIGSEGESDANIIEDDSSTVEDGSVVESQTESESISQSSTVLERQAPTGSKRNKRRRSTEIMDMIEKELKSGAEIDPLEEEIDGFLAVIKSHLRRAEPQKRLLLQSKFMMLLAETLDQ